LRAIWRRVGRKATSYNALGVKVRNQLGFQIADPVFKFELALLQARQSKLINRWISHKSPDGLIQITMLQLQLAKARDNFSGVVGIEVDMLRIDHAGQKMLGSE